MTKPADGFIPRELDPEVAAILSQFASGLEELVNFGSVLICGYSGVIDHLIPK